MTIGLENQLALPFTTQEGVHMKCSRRLSLKKSLSTLFSIVSIILGAILCQPALAAADSKGTDFWLTFTSNGDSATFTLFITSDKNTTGTVEIPGLMFNTTFSVMAGGTTTVQLPSNAELRSTDVVERKGIHVTSVEEVTVYGLNRRTASTDAYLGLPTDILGTDYVILGYKNVGVVAGSEFALVGTANDTVVTITPSVTTGTRAAGIPYSIVLSQGDTYQLINFNAAPADLSGTIVTSTKPIGVFAGHVCANIPSISYRFCDHIVEQLTPTSAWGKSFVTMPLATRIKGDTFRVVSGTDGTTVVVNGASQPTLNRGQFLEFILTGPSTITASKPIMVVQYSNSTEFDGVTSDPFQVLVPPYEQFLNSYTVSTPATGFDINYVNVVAPTSIVGSITIDGVAIPAASFVPIGSSGFSGAKVPVSVGSHGIAGPLPFGITMYGFAFADSYGYPGGMSLAPVATVTTLALAPKTAINPVNTQHCVTASVGDQFSRAVGGVRVDFAVSGANTTVGFQSTGANGQAQFCYFGTNAGDDLITAAVGTLRDTATKRWQAPARYTFVIGNATPHAVGSVVNFWGSQWWMTNKVTGQIGPGTAAFKGFAVISDNVCGGTWTSLPGDSSTPPPSVSDPVQIVVTDRVTRSGNNITGNIVRMLTATPAPGYGPSPGHTGIGTVSAIICQ